MGFIFNIKILNKQVLYALLIVYFKFLICTVSRFYYRICLIVGAPTLIDSQLLAEVCAQILVNCLED